MYAPSFAGCWAKIDRAKEHRDALQKHIEETFAVESNRPRLAVKFDPRTRYHIIYVQAMPDLSVFRRRCSVILGDIVHNLRSALDHVAFQLALKNTGGNLTNERRVQFPIEDTERVFQKRCSNKGGAGWIADLHQDDRAIIERFQVYHQTSEKVDVGTYPLAMLRDLSDADKHRLLTPLMIPPNRVGGVDPGFGRTIIDGHIRTSLAQSGAIISRPVEPGAELFWARVPHLTEDDVGEAGYIIPQIALSNGRAVVQAVDGMVSVVVKIVREFDPIQ